MGLFFFGTSLSMTEAPNPVTPQPGHPQKLAALYVGDLSPEVTESVLFELFKQAGAVQSIRVCRDSSTRVSLGYAYVNFMNAADAERALDTLNYTLLKGKPIRISWSQRDPSLRRSNVGNIFIKNLNKDIDSLALEEVFGGFGNIASCKVQTDSEGNSVGFGFVHFEKEEDAQIAIKEMDGKCLNGKPIFVGPFIPKKNRESVNSASIFTNVYVKDLPSSTTQEDFEKLFTPFGTVTSSMLSQNNGKPYGFVNFEKHDDAVKAVEEMNQKEVDGNTLYVSRAQNKAERQEFLRKRRQQLLEKTKNCNLYIRNLSDNVTEQTLRDTFSKYGTITSCKLMADRDGASRGFGFVCFSNQEEAGKALKSNEKLDGKPLYVAVAQRKAERRALMEIQHARRANFSHMANYPRGFPAHPSSFAPPGPVPQMGWPKEPVRFTGTQFFRMPGAQRGPVADAQLLLDQLRSSITPKHPETASQIANMIFDSYKEIGIEEINNLLKNPVSLQEKINEASAILAKNQKPE